MKRHQAGLPIVLLAAALSLAVLVAGCGEKIAIPQPSGVFSINRYISIDTFSIEGSVVQMTQARGLLYTLNGDKLTKRDTGFGIIGEVSGLVEPTALCRGDNGALIFVWENGAQRVTWFDPGSLDPMGSADLPDVQAAVALATNPAGSEEVPGAETFLYLSDPVAGVIHRYAFSASQGLWPYGILARSGGLGARFVNNPAGLANDSEGYLLACDVEDLRHWVLRFASTPDPLDTTPDPGDQDPLRGLAVIWDTPTCEPPATADYVIGNAAECQESDWVGGPSSEPGEFDRPVGIAVDGLGRIFVADSGNGRIQMFTPQGEYDLLFAAGDTLSEPVSLAVFDEDGFAANTINYGAFVFVAYNGQDSVVKYISYQHYIDLFNDPPPEQ